MNLAEKRRPAGPGGMTPQGLTTLVACAIIVAGIYLGRDLLVPLVLAVLLAFVLAPLVRLLRRLRLGRVVSVLVAVTVAFALLLGIGLAVSGQASSLVAELPRYQRLIMEKVSTLRLGELLGQGETLLRSLGVLRGAPGAGQAGPEAGGVVYGAPYQPESTLDIARNVAGPLLQPLATIGVVIVFTIFVLLYREDLRDRLIRLAGSRDLHRTMAAMNDAAFRLSRYFLTQVALNGCYGLFIGLGLWALGVPSPAIWGLLAGLMRFVPFVGTPIAIAPPLLLALAVDPGWGLALKVVALFLLTAPVMGQVLEPLLYGHSTGLSPISVIVSATFWAFLWGPIGLLLATPLTVCLVVLGRHVERLEFLDIILGDRPPLQPEETFYQRALERDADGLVAQARQHLREAPLSVYYDEVALRGLALAQGDWTREVLEPERMGEFRREVTTLLDDLDDEAEAPAAPVEVAAEDGTARPEGGPAPSWRLDGAVLCIAGRGPFDDLAAEMAAQILRRNGLGARAEPNTVLEAASLDRLDPARVRLCCISAVEEGSSAAAIRHFVRRLRRRLPEVRIVIGLWQAPPESPTLATLRSEGPGETIVTSLREAVALCGAVSAWAGRESEPAARP